MQAPSEERSDKFINLPARMILTAEGLKLFQKNGTPLKRVENREGITREGLESPRYNAATVQKMAMNSYLEEIFVHLPDLLSRRYDIISTNNLIVYAILYKKLSPSLAHTIFQTQVVRDFNRKNPKNSIVDLKHINPQQAEQLVKSHANLFKQIETDLKTEIIQRIDTHPSYNDEDRNAMRMSLPKFLAWIDKRIWFLYYIIYQTSMREQMKHVFAGMVAKYLEHTRIATHLSNLVMEFVQNAEKAHFERLI
ncbi:MAG: hypothetical protein KDK27_17850, partial [Leptospiraceae bacterium]|nr:hypothetical protein [Leptospiraceae bacterium]